MKRLLITLAITLLALTAGAAQYYAIAIGSNVFTDQQATITTEELTEYLTASGVLKSGTVGFSCTDDKATITLTDAVLSNARNDGVILLGGRIEGYDFVDFRDVEINVNGNCSITNTTKGAAALFIGGVGTTKSQNVTFTGNGNLTLTNSSGTGSGIMARYRVYVTINMNGPNITTTGSAGVMSLGNTVFIYNFREGTFKAEGVPYACQHESTMGFHIFGTRTLLDPIGAAVDTYNGIQSLCLNKYPVKSFTVGAKVYPLYVCGVQIDGDNRNTISNILKARGTLKSGEVSTEVTSSGIPNLVFDNATIEYSGTIVQNGNHNLADGTKTPGIDNLTVKFIGENTFTTDYVGIDNNHANISLFFYQGGRLTANTAYGIFHNMAMGQDSNPSGDYALTITGRDYNYGLYEPARLIINATNYGIMGDFGKIVYENAVTKINAAKQAIVFQYRDGIEPLVFKERNEEDTHGFRHGEKLTKTGLSYISCDAAGNETGSVEIGWIGKTYDIKFTGINFTDFHYWHPEAMFGNDLAKIATFNPKTSTLTFNHISASSTIESTASTSLPFIENNISGLTIMCNGQNKINYKGTLLRVNAPTKFKAGNRGFTLTLNSTEDDAVRIGSNGSLDVVQGTLVATGKTYGVRGATRTRPITYYGTLNMTGGTLKATGGNASIGSLLELNLNQSTIITPTGATWNSAKHAVVDASGNAIAGTTVEIAENLITYALKVGGVDVTNRNCDDILGNGTAVYDPETLTLTLNNANLNANMYNLRSEIEGLTIVLNGENHIKNAVAGTHHGIQLEECDGTTIMGDGTLTIESQGGRAIVYRSSKTVSDVYTTIKDATITTIDNGRYLSAAIYGDNTTAKINLTLDHTNIYMANGTLLLQGLTLNDCYIAKPENAIVGEGCIALETAQWSPYNGEIEILAQTQQETIVGDVDGSGTVDVDDVNAIIYIILGKKAASDYAGNADVDGTGSIDVDDVNKVIAIILNK